MKKLHQVPGSSSHTVTDDKTGEVLHFYTEESARHYLATNPDAHEEPDKEPPPEPKKKKKKPLPKIEKHSPYKHAHDSPHKKKHK